MASNKTCLLIDDDDNFVVLVEAGFSLYKFGHLRSVSNGLEAVQYLTGVGGYANRESFPLPDIILLDLKMPHMDGFEFLKWKKTAAPEKIKTIPVVVTSTMDFPEEQQRASQLGAKDFLPKPVHWPAFEQMTAELGIPFGQGSARDHQSRS